MDTTSVRLPTSLLDLVRERAKANRRSATAELAVLVENSLADDRARERPRLLEAIARHSERQATAVRTLQARQAHNEALAKSYEVTPNFKPSQMAKMKGQP